MPVLCRRKMLPIFNNCTKSPWIQTTNLPVRAHRTGLSTEQREEGEKGDNKMVFVCQLHSCGFGDIPPARDQALDAGKLLLPQNL